MQRFDGILEIKLEGDGKVKKEVSFTPSRPRWNIRL